MTGKSVTRGKRFKTAISDSPVLPVCLSFFVVVAMNLSLEYIIRDNWSENPLAYLPRLFNGLSFVQFFESYSVYVLFIYLRRHSAIKYEYLIPSLLFAFFMIEGHYFESDNAVDFFTNEKFFNLVALVAAAGYTVLFLLSFSLFDHICLKICKSQLLVRNGLPGCSEVQFFYQHTFIISFLFLIVSVVPLLILTYPGQFMGDTPSQIAQALMEENYSTYATLNESSMLINHHPVIHTMLIRLCLNIGLRVFNSYNVGIFIYVALQIFVMSICVAYVAYTLVHKYNVADTIVLIMLVYLVIHPRFHQYFVLVTKDSIYCTLLLVFVCAASLMVSSRHSTTDIIVLYVASILCSLFRREAFFITVPAVIMLSLFKSSRKQSLMLLISLVAVFVLWNRILLPLMDVVPGSRRSSQSIPFQQTARYLKEYPDDVTENEREVLDTLFPDGNLAEDYDQNIADPILHKFNEDATNENLADYYAVWLSMFWRHPDSYFRAFLGKNYQFFFPSKEVSNYNPYKWSVSRMEVTNSTCDSSFSPSPLLLSIGVKLESLREAIVNMPLINFIASAFTYIYLAVFFVFYSFIHKQWSSLALSTVFVTQIAVLMAGPTNGYYFRYMIPIVAILPFLYLFNLSIQSTVGPSQQSNIAKTCGIVESR